MIFSTVNKDNTIVGVSLGGKMLKAALLKNGELLKTYEKEIDNNETEDVVVGEVIVAIEAVMCPEVVGIGIGVPSMVDTERGIVYTPVNIPSWKEVHLKTMLEQHFNCNVLVNNDANCFVVGEMYFGQANEYANIVGLVLGDGMGAGIITNGRLYMGTNYGAGEFGAIPYRDHNYEYYCTSGYFLEKYGVRWDIMNTRAKQDDKIALAVFELFGFDLGYALKTIMLAIDPEIIVIGGPLAEAFPFYEQSMWKAVGKFLYPTSVGKIRIVPESDPNIGVKGAAALYLNKFAN